MSEDIFPETRMKLRVLLVDDDDSCHRVMNLILSSPPPLNLDLSAATSLAKGLEIDSVEQLTIVLLDLSMPGTERIEVLSAIRKFRAPVILFTGHGQEDVWLDAIKFGALDCLQKEIYLERRNRGALLHSILNAYFLFYHHPKLKNGSP